MNSNLLQSLDALVAQDLPVSRQSFPILQVESKLAALLLDEKLPEVELFVDDAFVETQETLAAVETGSYPFRPGFSKRITSQIMRLQKKKLLAAIIQKLQDVYGLDEAFSDMVKQFSAEIKTAVDAEKSAAAPAFPNDWLFPKIALTKRAILLDLSRAWTQENVDEPILWKISTSLQAIVGCSFYAVSEAFAQLYLAANVTQNAGSKDSIASFFVALNDDKAGNVLDNLVVSQAAYQTLLDEGWQPDRWEIENLPMTIGMFLDFISKNGFNRVENIGDVLEINLQAATENYRYRGSPFLSADDLKKVKVTVPGWEISGELVIRPKVSEISLQGD